MHLLDIHTYIYIYIDYIHTNIYIYIYIYHYIFLEEARGFGAQSRTWFRVQVPCDVVVGG